MPQYMVTPWRDHAELLGVRNQLWHSPTDLSSADERRLAVDRIEVWTIRGNCPHAVMITGQLMDIVLEAETNTTRPTMLRAAYALVFSRFVTGFCDIGQNTASKRTMMDLAETIEMPISFVELRHEITHGQLPSLVRLSQHAKLGLVWLEKHYWAKLEERLPNAPPAKRRKTDHNPEGPVSKEDLVNVLNPFRMRRREEIKMKIADANGVKSASGQAATYLVTLCKGEGANLDVLTRILVSEKMLVPANRSVGDNMGGAYLFWDNFLLRMTVHQDSFIGSLLREMVRVLAQPQAPETICEAVYEWIGHIFAWHGGICKVKQILDRVEGERGSAVNECILAPNSWTAKLARRLVSETNEIIQLSYLPLLASLENI